eukprot:1433797-Lingulodinium_polyedra.AAC.1
MATLSKDVRFSAAAEECLFEEHQTCAEEIGGPLRDNLCHQVKLLRRCKQDKLFRLCKQVKLMKLRDQMK